MRLTSLTSKWLSLALVLLGTNAGSPPVKVSLRSSWPAPPLLLEIMYASEVIHKYGVYSLNEPFDSESAALENPDVFFPLVDKLTDPKTLPSPQPTTPEAIHAFALSVVEGYLSEQGSLASFTANLALHASTPKIQAFYQYYVDRDLDARAAATAQGETLVRLAGTDTVDSAENRASS
jgi:UDP-glucose:glycoprotein glucosyltransferase